MHRVGRLEAERGAARAAERLEQLLYDLVGAVRRPHLLGGDAVAEVVGEVLAQLDGVPVGVAVERARDARDRVRDRRAQALARRVRVLVGVELDGDVELRRAVGVQVPQVRAKQSADDVGRGLLAAHWAAHWAASLGTRTRTAATCACRSSAPPSASTRRRHGGEGVAVALDDVDDLEVRVDRQAAGVPGGAARRQDVVGAGQVVAEGDRAVRADEDRAGVPDLARDLGGVVGLHLQVLGRPGVGDPPRGGEVVDQDVAGLAARARRARAPCARSAGSGGPAPRRPSRECPGRW